MSLMITALKPQRRNPDLVDLHIDGEPCGSIAWAVICAEELSTGDEISQESLDRLLAGDERWKAKQAALSLLAARARSRGELADRLRRKGYGDEAVQSALGEVERLGFIDDTAFAESWVRDRLRLRPRGTQALIHELGRKRVNADVARAAITRVMRGETISDDELCMAAAARWARSHAPLPLAEEVRRLERRLSAYLARRGYRHDAIRAVVDVILRRGRTDGADLVDEC